ncbi:MAG: carbohydrate kinase [Lewinella sp.]|nr:carbohydrate kinase [Lewinella sp.]
MKVTAIFDIGKTNKKFFLFDRKFQQIHKVYTRFPEKTDEDGYPCDDLAAIQHWMRETLAEAMALPGVEVEAINFSTYGATMVHLDRYGKPLTPLYNYTKPYPQPVLDRFHAHYGSTLSIAHETASPPGGMLNAGLQLYWLKHTRPEVYSRIRYSLHFPQYLSYLFTGVPLSEYTSIGCHTSLWDYSENDYHTWVYTEGIDQLLPPIVSTGDSINVMYEGQRIRVGVGIHDSSAALLPYLRAEKKPFMLISTGTWSIALNPFSKELLTEEELNQDCLNYLRVDGLPVKAARLFLGNEYKLQVEKICAHFGVDYGFHRDVRFSEAIYQRLMSERRPWFHFESLPPAPDQPAATDLGQFPDFATAFHALMIELLDRQQEVAWRVVGQTPIKKIYIDGGFVDNDTFIKLASHHFSDLKLRTTQSPLGSALGAAMVISDQQIKAKFLKKHYAMRKHEPLILSA